MAAEPPALFSKKGFYGALMDWAMRDEHFKTQLFRFVDVLPSLTSAGEIARHLKEYLGDEQLKLSPALRLGLKAAGGASWLFGSGVKAQVTGMARQFMLGNDEKEIAATLRKLHEQGIAFTVDVLGEAVVSEAEADEYVAALPAADGFPRGGNCSMAASVPEQRIAPGPAARAECFGEALGPLLADPSC